MFLVQVTKDLLLDLLLRAGPLLVRVSAGPPGGFPARALVPALPLASSASSGARGTRVSVCTARPDAPQGSSELVFVVLFTRVSTLLVAHRLSPSLPCPFPYATLARPKIKRKERGGY